MPQLFSITPAALDLLRECPRCFWLSFARKGVLRRPQTGTPESRDDARLMLHKRFDAYRTQGLLPPEIKKNIPGFPVPQKLIALWRDPKKGIRFRDTDGAVFRACMDECVLIGARHIPARVRFAGAAVRQIAGAGAILELSCYNFLLERAGFTVSRYAYDISYAAAGIIDEKTMEFKISFAQVPTLSPGAVHTMFRQAVDLLRNAVVPSGSSECRFCAWADRVAHLDRAQIRLF